LDCEAADAASPKPGELLFDFVHPCDRAIVRCELRFHGESYGWEVQFFEGPASYSRAAGSRCASCR